MRKIFLFVAAVFCTTMMYAVPAPTNVHWDGKILKWELPALTNDSVYEGVYVSLYTKTGGDEEIYQSGLGGDATDLDLTNQMFQGRTYYATIYLTANPGEVSGPKLTTEDYTVPGDAEVIAVPDVALSNSGTVTWGYIDYMIARATLQKKNGLVWDDIKSETTTNGWHKSVSFGAITTPGTYRAVVEGLQGTDVVRRGYSDELEIDELFTVTFNANGLDPFTAIDPVVVAKNSIINAPDLPAAYIAQSNHAFYWSTDEAGDNVWYFDTAHVTADITLYAQWIVLPALNPVWDGDVCRWTLAEKYRKIFSNLVVGVYTEGDNEVLSTGTTTITDNTTMGFAIYHPGRKYKFKVALTDFSYNRTSATSDLRTIDGDVSILPLTNMTVINTLAARVTWDNPVDATYIRHGVLSRWNKGTSAWDEIATKDDADANWNYSYIEFDEALDAEQYYRIHCQLNQGEYKIYEGEMFYGTNPATGVDEIVNGQSSNRKFIKDGQLFIERDGKTFNAQGVEVR